MARSDSVETRLRNASAVLAGLLLLVGIVAAAGVAIAEATVGDVVDRLDPLAETNRELLQHLTDAESGERGFLVTGDDRFLEPFVDGRDAFGPTLERARALADGDPQVQALLTRQEEIARRWLDGFAAPIIETRRTDEAAAAARAATGEGRRLFTEFREVNGQAQDVIAAARRDAAARVSDTARGTAFVLLALAVAAAAGGTVVARRAARHVTTPLTELQGAIDRLRGGDLSTRVDAHGPTEVAAVGAALNQMAGEVQRLSALERARAGQEILIRSTAQAFRQHLHEQLVLNSATEAIGRALEADRVAVWGAADGATGALRARWGRNGGDGPAEESVPPPLLQLAGRTLRSGVGPLSVDDVATDDRLPEPVRTFLLDQDVHSFMLIPIRSFDAVTSALTIQAMGEARAWDTADVAVAEAVARELGIALEHAQLYARQQDAVAELRRLDDAKTAFVSSVSHELRTPLTSILGFTELLRDGDGGPVTPEQDAMLDVVDRNAARLLALIDDLLTLSRLEAGGIARDDEPVDLPAVIERAVAGIATARSGRNLEVAVDVRGDDGPLVVRGDAVQLERALLNLLTNAQKFTPDGGRISVGCRRAGDDVRLVVTDTGMGIPAGEQGQLFSRFFRSSTARANEVQGTGLGLVIVKGIVEDHGGRIDVRSVEGEGTAFIIHLPATADEPDGDAPVPGAAPQY